MDACSSCGVTGTRLDAIGLCSACRARVEADIVAWRVELAEAERRKDAGEACSCPSCQPLSEDAA